MLHGGIGKSNGLEESHCWIGGRCLRGSLLQVTDQQGGVLIRTGQAFNAGPFYDYPIDAKARLQAHKVADSKVVPSELRFDFVLPARRQAGNLGSGNCRILNDVGQDAALGQSTKAVIVLAGTLHVSGARSEIGVGGKYVSGSRRRPAAKEVRGGAPGHSRWDEVG